MAATYQQLAHRYVLTAVRLGHLPALDGFVACVDCGKPADHYDHRDYALPLHVAPVCARCNIRRGPAKNHFERPLKKARRMLARARIAKGMTQKQLARAVGVDQAHISKIESQNTYLSDEVAARLTKILGVPAHAVKPRRKAA